MPRLPRFSPTKRVNDSPHVVILGAGASRAAIGNAAPLMADLVETVGLAPILEQYGIAWIGKNFEDIYSDLADSNRTPEPLSALEAVVRKYFYRLQIPKQTTLYDQLLLSLRPKDLIATFNWDPLLVHAYARNRKRFPDSLPQMVQLHGDVITGVCHKDRIRDYVHTRCQKCKETLPPIPLLWPIKKKDYATDPFIKAQWDALRAHLAEAYFVTIFGYGAPKSDVEAIKVMHSVWQENPTKELAQIEIINTLSSAQSRRDWANFIVRDHVSVHSHLRDSFLSRFPRRSCEALAEATLQNDPWRGNPYPILTDLDQLHDWITPLVAEEQELLHSGRAFSILPLSMKIG